jgi:hypothetical protein
MKESEPVRDSLHAAADVDRAVRGILHSTLAAR